VPITSVRTVGDLYRVYDPAGPVGPAGAAAPGPSGARVGERRDDARRSREARTGARDQS
jgi:hypothetical protein